MSLEGLIKQLESHQHAPTEQWDPEYCGEIPMVIKANGDWYYQGSKINRPRLVKLFASVLVKEGEEYFLVTPAERIKITVEDVPFVILGWETIDQQGHHLIQVVSNIEERYILSEKTPLVLENGVPYVELPRGMKAKVHRNVFYQWAEIAESISTDDGVQFVLKSAGQTFSLGRA